MTSEILLFLLRLVSSGLLLAFVGAVFIFLWRDYRATALELKSRRMRRGRLVVMKSGDDVPIKPGASYPLLPLTSVGRAPTNTIALDDSFASSEHAVFTLRGGQWWLEDRGSMNGTLLNGEKLEEPTVVSSGDVIGVGRVELKLELD